MNIKNKVVEEILLIAIALVLIGVFTMILEKLNATIGISFGVGGLVGMVYLLITEKIVGENKDE